MAGDEPLVVAIDGPSGVGKSTIARLLAARLAVPVLDTGAMYRAVTLDLLERGVDLDDAAAVVAAATAAEVDLRVGADGRYQVLLGGRPVGSRIRARRVSDATSRVAVHPAVRRRMVRLQRAWGARAGAVVEGRDIGTVVFPHTPHKFFLDARPAVRLARRAAQLAAAGAAVDPVELEAELAARDRRDRDRPESPLVCDERYHAIDTSERSPDEVVAAMLARIRPPVASPRA